MAHLTSASSYLVMIHQHFWRLRTILRLSSLLLRLRVLRVGRPLKLLSPLFKSQVTIPQCQHNMHQLPIPILWPLTLSLTSVRLICLSWRQFGERTRPKNLQREFEPPRPSLRKLARILDQHKRRRPLPRGCYSQRRSTKLLGSSLRKAQALGLIAVFDMERQRQALWQLAMTAYRGIQLMPRWLRVQVLRR